MLHDGGLSARLELDDDARLCGDIRARGADEDEMNRRRRRQRAL
jgi:hypothetical protein